MDSIRGVFESLNCVICKEPFARVANHPRSPRHLECGTTMCNECCEKEQRLPQNNKKHHCSLLISKFHYLYAAFYLIDVLSQEDALILAPKNRGYLLAKPFKIPECPVCHDEYSNQIEEKKSAWLYCGHIICTQCYLKMQNASVINCPVCRRASTLRPNPEQNRFNDFLDELPEMTRQMKETRSCDDCQKTDYIDQMFHCPECDSKSCGYCAYRKHRQHEAISLLATEVAEVTKELQNVCKTYKGIFPELHKELLEGIDTFETKVLLKGEILGDVSSTAVLKEEQETLIKMKTDFEATAVEYLPQLRKMNTKVKEMIRALDKPDMREMFWNLFGNYC